MVEVAEKDPRVGAVGSVLYDMNNPNRVQAWGGGKVNLWFGRSSLCAEQTPEDELSYLTGASLLLRRKSIEEVGLLDEAFFMYWEDVDLCFRLRKAGWKLAVARDSQVWHKESASVDAKRIAFDRYLWTSTVRFCDRHAPLSLIPKVIATARMVAKRFLRFQWMRAARLCQTVAVHSRDGAPKLNETDRQGAVSGEEQ
jgi:GT2 family glycosyltransferase